MNILIGSGTNKTGNTVADFKHVIIMLIVFVAIAEKDPIKLKVVPVAVAATPRLSITIPSIFPTNSSGDAVVVVSIESSMSSSKLSLRSDISTFL